MQATCIEVLTSRGTAHYANGIYLKEIDAREPMSLESFCRGTAEL